MKALLFGAIGTVAETSELQRQAFNQAFADAELEWQWDVDTYKQLLSVAGGQNRIRHYAKQTSTELDETLVQNLHQKKTELYNAMLENDGIELRTGVERLIAEALEADIKLGFATATSKQNIEAIDKASKGKLQLSKFDVVMNADKLEHRKPHPETYERCLEQLGLSADEVVAIEDTAESLESAVRAGICTVATPGKYTQDQDFSKADAVVSHLGTENEQANALRSNVGFDGVVTVAWLSALLKNQKQKVHS